MSLALGRLRPIVTFLAKRNRQVNLATVRYEGTVVYRKQFLQEPPSLKFAGTALSFVLWYWVLYHCWYEFDHLKGHAIPDASKWTNEELGIPPDDEE
ncbi:NADH dehydrogenase [ubiquinone] 1 beta subcomplex subunit 2, mitochondrial-like [Physella acuta]|uniref:NADH dehydrogenase [ubiquinone] 1 beta subcomplex subunit 2, mitochondrial-like n=1 Tax=Physella acuta TaxID=109671 RepID=UPI0027DDD51D|nr:NADH dehydrogenase [ubiquinone] 1 beta subcomplex subunit 2, mitochondrial-like [Physella acuta]